MVLASLLLASLAQASAAEVPFRVGENAIIVDAFVNKRKLSFMFDTGFTGSIVIDSDVNIGPPTGSMTLRDFVGQFEAKTIDVTSLRLGSFDAKTPDMKAVQLPQGNSSFAYNAHVDGIMGFEVVSKRITEINFAKKAFVFLPATTDISKRVPDNQKTFLVKMLPKGNGSIELEAVTSNGKKLILGLDTGNAFYATTHKDVLERVGMWTPGQKPRYVKSSFVASGEVASWSKRMKDMSIFGVPVAESYWDIIDLPSSQADHDGTVGFQFLKNFNITIDYDRRRVWLERISDNVGNAPKGEVGASVAFDQRIGRVRIYRVAPAGPAGKAGVKYGDEVLSIDGRENLEQMSNRQLSALFEGEKGSTMQLTVSRAGEVMRFDLVRDYLFNE